MLRCRNKEDKDIIMVEGDYGISLPITIIGTTIPTDDVVSFCIKDLDGNTVVDIDYTNIVENKFDFVLTEQQSDKLKAGWYIYQIDWYRNGVFLGNIINSKDFIVEEKR